MRLNKNKFGKWIGKFLLVITLNLLPVFCLAQPASFCEIEAVSPSQKISQAIRFFNLSYYQPAQLNGTFECKNGDIYTLKTSCVGSNRVGIISISNPEAVYQPSNATRLFHLYTKTPGKDDALMPCILVPVDQ